jgi:hypothetical protein
MVGAVARSWLLAIPVAFACASEQQCSTAVQSTVPPQVAGSRSAIDMSCGYSVPMDVYALGKVACHRYG